MYCLALKILRLPLSVAVLHGCQRLNFMDKTMDKLSPVDRPGRVRVAAEPSYKYIKPRHAGRNRPAARPALRRWRCRSRPALGRPTG